MNSVQPFIRYTRFVLLMVFMVILAGGVVRMTQSGMGCPDWPKCFGRWIPPTRADQLPPDFEKYLSKQDIDHSFNVYHTWIEYINRLLGALLGIFIFIHLVWSWRKFRKINQSIFGLSLFMFLAVAFQGWLGKKVVDANLASVKVTLHMLVALLIAVLPVIILHKLRGETKLKDGFLRNFSIVFLVLLLVQVILGTQVREQVDEISKSLKYAQRDLWISRLDKIFIIHRSFSWVLLLAILLMVYKAWRHSALRRHVAFIFALVVSGFVIGILMYWYHIPAIAQPIHLLIGCLLVASAFAFLLRIEKPEG